MAIHPTRGRAARSTVPCLLLAALLLALAACGGDGGDGSGDGANGAPSATGAEEREARPAEVDVPQLIGDVSPSVVAVQTGEGTARAEGSGVVWDGEAIVTNAHVVQGAPGDVTVTLASGRRLAATVRAADPRSDLAVISTERDDLPAPTFADDLPRVGERAIALGNPLGFEDTATAGIVSGLDRAIPTGGRTPALVGLIQTDAAISPGNSGGALVGPTGEVIGINIAYIPPQARAVAIGFAIPAPEVRHVVESLLENGEVDHSFLGVELAPLTPGLAQDLGRDTDRGAVIVRAVEGGPAARAGAESGDVIVAMGDDRVESVEDVYAGLRARAPGDELELTVSRNGDERTFDVTLDSRE